ncbi:MAG: gamma-glutamyltransferase [Bacillota bacterium]|nr:gamma-glutamyltransferase [Bacillota bacterium]
MAARVGEHILSAGGNAIDAGVAAGLAINVLLFDRTSFGGVAPIILYHARSGKLLTLDGLGVWPRLANLEHLQREYGGRMPEGILRSVTPGAPDAWLTALERFGTLTLGEVMEPALELAADGAPTSTCVAGTLRGLRGSIDKLDPVAVETFFPGRRAPDPGTVLVQPDLARVFRALIEEEARARRLGAERRAAIGQARDLFYKGWIAEEIDAFHKAHGGWMRREDLAAHAVEVAPPLHTSYHGYDVYTCGPWCQGPLLIQFLNILGCFEVDSFKHNSFEYLHLLIEAMNLALSDRENFYGDPHMVDVPINGLISKEYAREQAARIRSDRAAGAMPAPGNPWRFEPGSSHRSVAPIDVSRYVASAGSPPGDTSYVATGDREGNLFSATPSDPVFHTPMIPGLGFSCSGRGSQSRVVAGHPSALAPGKRPRLTPNPALVMLGGRPFMAFGCPGADSQTQAMLQFFLNLVHFGMNPQQAIESPRVMSLNYPASFAPHQYYPGRVDVESRIPAAVRARLHKAGHDVRVASEWAGVMSSVHAVLINPSTGVLLGAADPRRPGAAIGW